jgi:hypothetical protein
MQPVMVLPLPRRVGLDDIPGGFGQILGQVADVSPGLVGAAEDALGVDLSPEGHHVRRLLDLFYHAVPLDKGLPGVRVYKGLVPGIPDRQVITAVDQLVMCWPPHLVVGRLGDLPDDFVRDRPAQGRVQVRGGAFLGFDGGEVLDVPPDDSPEVLTPPVDERGEVHGVACRPSVVIRRHVDWCAVVTHAAVGVAGEGDEHGGPEFSGVLPAHGGLCHFPPWQVRRILPPPCGALHRSFFR